MKFLIPLGRRFDNVQGERGCFINGPVFGPYDDDKALARAADKIRHHFGSANLLFVVEGEILPGLPSPLEIPADRGRKTRPASQPG